MWIGKFVKLLLLLILAISCHRAMSQERFISYQDFEFAYKRNPNMASLGNRFNLLYILLLDPSHKQQIFKYSPQLEESFNGYSNGMKLNKSTVGFVTHHTGLMKIFSSSGRIMNCIFDESINPKEKHFIKYPIYIKDNSAIAEIMTNNTSDVYYFRLHKGIVQINWLGGSVE